MLRVPEKLADKKIVPLAQSITVLKVQVKATGSSKRTSVEVQPLNIARIENSGDFAMPDDNPDDWVTD